MQRARILLADDHAEFLSLAALLIEAEFDVVRRCGDGQEVLDRLEEEKPDVLVLDISMPKLSGIRVAQDLKVQGSGVKIVFLTVHKDADYLRSALDTGALGYVVKDRLASDLIPAVRSALAGKQFVSESLVIDSHPIPINGAED